MATIYLCERCRTVVDENDESSVLRAVRVESARGISGHQQIDNVSAVCFFHRWCWTNSPRYRLISRG